MENKAPKARAVRLAALIALLSVVFATAAMAAITNFVDVPDDHLFAAEIAWMDENDITRGCNPPENDRYCPDDDITRGEMAAFMYRMAHTETLRDHFGGTSESFYIVTEVGALSGEPTAVTATCEVGDTVAGGGYEADGVTLVTADRPGLSDEPVGAIASAWTVSATGTGDLSVYALCVTQS